jgi:hypothetical protein
MVLVEQKSVHLVRLPDISMVLHSGHVMYQESNRRPTEDELSALYLGVGTAA